MIAGGVYRSPVLPPGEDMDAGGAAAPYAEVLRVVAPRRSWTGAYDDRYFHTTTEAGHGTRPVAPAFSAYTGETDLRTRRADLVRKSALLLDLAAAGAPECLSLVHAPAIQRRLAAYEALDARRDRLRVLLARDGARSARPVESVRARARR